MDASISFPLALASALALLPPADRVELAAVGQVSEASSRLPTAAQPVVAAIPWNWPVAGPNQISLQQFTFSDTQPQSCEAGAEFLTGGSSVSEAYAMFLQIIDAVRFPSPDLLRNAIAARTPPPVPPAEPGHFSGWVAVPNSGGVLEYRPEYSISMLPTQWHSFIGSRLKVTGSPQGFLSDSGQAAEIEKRASAPELTATSVLRVPIYAGAWYNQAMVRLAADGPFVNEVSPDRVVGDHGFLRCRITEIFVAAGLTVGVTVPEDAVPMMAGHLNTPAARMGPLPIRHAEATVAEPAPGGGTRYTLTAAPEVPFIIGVTVQRFTR